MKYFIYCRKSEEAEDRQVLSLESQSDEVKNVANHHPNIEVVGFFTEARSAKQPGRTIFNQMMARIEAGEAEGIIAWHPDRLARNSVDGGQIIHLLDQGKLTDLKFCNYSFENSSNGKFMLTITFGQSKYYVDILSENVHRGLRTKLKNGWFPNRAPIGYRNNKDTSEIEKDPIHAAVVRRMFNWVLSTSLTRADIHRKLRDELNYLTPIRKTTGGKHLSRSQVDRILSNPFYAGYLPWGGELLPGAHEPIITKQEFTRVQTRLNVKSTTRTRQHQFLFRGVFRCGECNKSVTAERKRKPSGRTYIYYHCTRVHNEIKCQQPSIEERQLRAQWDAFLATLLPTPKLIRMAHSGIKIDNLHAEQAAHKKRLERERRDTAKQLDTLTDLRLRDVVTDEQFTAKRQELTIKEDKLKENLASRPSLAKMFEPIFALTILLNKAVFFFQHADQAAQRKLLHLLCSNSLLQDKTALFSLAIPGPRELEKTVSRILLAERRTNRTNSSNERHQKELEDELARIHEWGQTHHDAIQQAMTLLDAQIPPDQCLQATRSRDD